MILKKMICTILLNILVSSILASGTTLVRVTHNVTDTNCNEVNKPDWTLDNLKNVELKDWPWVCVDLRYPNDQFKDAFTKLNISLNDAASRGYIGFVQFYTEKLLVPLNDRNRDGNTPLHLAVQNKHEEVIKYIARKVSKPRELNKHNYENNTPLMLAAHTCQTDIVKYFFYPLKVHSSYSDSDVAELLNATIKGGCYPVLDYLIEDARYSLDKNDISYLSSAAIGGNVDVLKYLVEKKKLVTKGVDQNGNTALHLAALHGKIDMVEYLINDLKYDRDIKNKKGESPSHSAAEGGSLPVLEYLIDDKRADLKAVNWNGKTILHYAAEYGHLPIVQYLVDRKGVNVDEQDEVTMTTPSRRAIRANKFPVVKYLVDEKGADLKLDDEYLRTAVHEAAQSGNVDIMKYVLDDKKLINELNKVDIMKKTPARDAVEFGHFEMLKHLVDERHANITGIDSTGDNILQTAVKFDRLPIVKYLIEEKGFNPNDKNSRGKSLTKLTKDRQVLEYLRTKMTPEPSKS